MKILKIVAALLLTVSPALAQTFQQSNSVSALGTAGRMVGGSVTVNGVGSASVNIPGGSYSYSANGIGAPSITAPTSNPSAKINVAPRSTARSSGFSNFSGVNTNVSVTSPGFQAPSIPSLSNNFGAGFSIGMNSGLFKK